MSMGANKAFKGSFAALVTPLTNTGELAKDELQKLIDWQIRSGTDGFFVSGSTGQGPILSDNVRKELLELCMKMASPDTRVIAHVGHIAHENALDLARHAERHGADAISSVPPIYFKASPKEFIEYYRDLASVVDIPLFIYYTRQLGVRREISYCLDELFSIPNVVGMKYSDRDVYEFSRFVATYNDKTFFYGCDEQVIAALVMGATGSIGMTQNILPVEFKEMYNAVLREDIKLASEIQSKINNLIEVLLPYGITGWYECLKLKGFGTGIVAPSLRPLSEEQLTQMREELKGLGYV